MDLKELKKNWHEFGRKDPFWAILSLPGTEGNKWDLDQFFKTGRLEIEEALEFVARRGVRVNFGRALDFGCGAGRLTQALAQRFEEAYGIDIAPSMIKLATEYNQYPESCHYQLNEESNLGCFQDKHFDFIYTCRVLQHMKPEYAFNYIAEFVRLLKPGGVIVLQEPTEKLPVPMESSKTEADSAKSVLKRLIPQPLLKWYYKARWEYLSSKQKQMPKMEMYGISIEEMKAFITKQGAFVHAVVPDDSCPDWQSFCYLITKDKVEIS